MGLLPPEASRAAGVHPLALFPRPVGRHSWWPHFSSLSIKLAQPCSTEGKSLSPEYLTREGSVGGGIPYKSHI